jgi:hypothetical protein
MTINDSIICYSTRVIDWLNPAVYILGLCIAVWAFIRCRKRGYLVVAFYFALVVFQLFTWPAMSRAIRAHRAPDISSQTQEKINAAIQNAIHKILVEEGHPEGIPMPHTVICPFGPILLVVGLWLVARRETHLTNTHESQVERPE